MRYYIITFFDSLKFLDCLRGRNAFRLGFKVGDQKQRYEANEQTGQLFNDPNEFDLLFVELRQQFGETDV